MQNVMARASETKAILIQEIAGPKEVNVWIDLTGYQACSIKQDELDTTEYGSCKMMGKGIK